MADYCLNFWTLCVFEPLWGLEDNVLCSSYVHWKLVVDFLFVLIDNFFSLDVTAVRLRRNKRILIENRGF